MKYFCIIFCAIFCSVFCTSLPQHSCDFEEFSPLVDDFGKSSLSAGEPFPRNFRIIQEIVSQLPPRLLKGGENLRVVGTGQFTESQLNRILDRLKTKIIIIDLRAETHLLFRGKEGDEIPITACLTQSNGNAGKSREEIEREEMRYKAHINNSASILLFRAKSGEIDQEKTPLTFAVGHSITEREAIEKMKASYPVDYVRIPVQDHTCPSAAWVDAFLQLYREEKNKAVFLFHCQAGRGRTGLFMLMVDVIENAVAYNISFDEFLERQKIMGSPDFEEISPDKVEKHIKRYNFLRHFYCFAVSKDGLSAGSSFSAWQSKHKILDYYREFQSVNTAIAE